MIFLKFRILPWFGPKRFGLVTGGLFGIIGKRYWSGCTGLRRVFGRFSKVSSSLGPVDLGLFIGRFFRPPKNICSGSFGRIFDFRIFGKKGIGVQVGAWTNGSGEFYKFWFPWNWPDLIFWAKWENQNYFHSFSLKLIFWWFAKLGNKSRETSILEHLHSCS